MDITDELSEKEKAITEAENALGVVEESCDSIEKEITLLRIQRDELGIKIKRREQDLDTLKPDIRKGKHNIARLKREHSQLFRGYIKQRDQAKGMR